ncbi:MAG: right-handed parallel beta-helix repeat-containing protein [Thermomicrobiales bacterium]
MAHAEPGRRRSWTWKRGAATLRVLMALVMLLPVWTGLLGGAAAQQALPTARCQDSLERDAASKVMRLLRDCVTSASIEIADGWTFDGDDHFMYAQDPPGGQLAAGVLRVAQGTATVQDVTIDGRGLTQPCRFERDDVVSGVAIAGASGAVQRVTVRRFTRPQSPSSEPLPDYQRQACGTGVRITGAAANVTVSDSTLEDLGYAGVVIDAGMATVSRNAIRRAAVLGVFAFNGARVRVTPENQIREGHVGVQFEGAGTSGRIAGNVVAHMDEAGIVVIDRAQASVANNVIEDAANTGISVKFGGRAALTDNRVTGGIFGIAADAAELTMSGSSVTGSSIGIGSFTGAQITVRESHVRDCNYGIGAASGQIIIHDSSVVTCAGAGVQAEQGGTLEAHGVRVTQSQVGLRAQSGSTATVTNSAFSRNTLRGVVAVQGSQLTLERSSLTDAGEYGILLTDPGTTGIITDTLVSGATVRSVETMDGARLTASDLRVYGGVLGIYVAGLNSVAEISDSFIAGAGTNVSVVGGGEATLTRLFSAGGEVGVAVRSADARATIRESTIQQATLNGVQAIDGGWVSVEHSEVLDAEGTGVLLRRDEAPLPVSLLEMDAQGCVQDEVRLPGGRHSHAFLTVQNHDTQLRRLVVDELGLTQDVPPASQRSIELGGDVGSFRIRCEVTEITEMERTAVLRFVPPAEIARPASPGERLVVTDSVIRGGKYGVYAHGPALLATVSDSTITGAVADGVVASRDATVSVRGTAISDTGEAGIEAREGAQATITGNIIEDAGTIGIRALSTGTTATVTDNQISGAGSAGITISESASGTVLDNVISESGGWGIAASGAGTSGAIRENTVTGGVAGIAVDSGASASVGGNTVERAHETGVMVVNATASVTGNVIRDPGRVGVQALDGATLLALRNELTRNGATPITGIRLEPGVRGAVQDNAFSGFVAPGACGLDLPADAAALDVNGNTIAPATAPLICGPAPAPAATPLATPVAATPSQATPVAAP